MLDKLVKIYDEFAKGGRVQDLEQLASEQGFPFVKRVSFGPQPTDLKAFKVFSKKGSKRLIGVITMPLKAFKGVMRCYDYLNTKELETFSYTVIEIFCEDLYTDYFIVQPKGAFKKMKGIFTSGHKPFPHLKEFHSQFVISADNPEGELLLKESALDSMVEFPGLTCEANGSYFLFYYRKKEIKISDIMEVAEFAEEFVRLTKYDFSGDFV